MCQQRAQSIFHHPQADATYRGSNLAARLLELHSGLTDASTLQLICERPTINSVDIFYNCASGGLYKQQTNKQTSLKMRMVMVGTTSRMAGRTSIHGTKITRIRSVSVRI